MKKYLFLLTAGLGLAMPLHAALFLDEPFTYGDGSLITVSGGLWAAHSGAGQVEVSSGKINVTQTRGEDVNRLIPGGPYSNGVLYASFVVNFSLLPSGAGTYFAHLKDDGIMNFRCKAFATTTNSGTASGKFRVGIARGAVNAPAMIPADLSLGSNYTLVVRYDCATTASTLWLSPNNEDSTDRAEGTDTGTTVIPIHSFAFRQSLSMGTGMGSMTVDDLKVGTNFCEVVTCGSATMNPPSVSGIGEQRIPVNSATPAIPFTVSDAETPASSLAVSAASDNPTLVPNNPANIALAGTGTNRTITITPAANEQGTATITISVTDGDNNTTLRSFLVVVGAPTISAVPNKITSVDIPTAAIPFLVGDGETPAGSLGVTMYSFNPVLVPPGNVSIMASGSNRTAIITPAAGLSGLAQIGFIVSDGTSTASNSFILTVAPAVGLDATDDFDYADGAAVPNSSFFWDRHSGGTNEMQVLGGKLKLTSSQSEDVHSFVGFTTADGYFKTNVGYVLYNSFTVNFSALPGSDYFAHYKDLGTINFRARVFATTNGAAPGKFRLGIANALATPNAICTNDLSLGANYNVMVRYNVGTAESKLWVNPVSESSYGVEATDAAIPVDIWQYAFRQSTGIGSLCVDAYRVGGTFALAYMAPNWPPSITSIPDQVLEADTPSGAIPFTIGDVETPSGSLTLSAASTNTTLIPVGNIVFGGSDSNRTVMVTPVTGESGVTLVTVTVTDPGGQSTSASFLVAVGGIDNPPSISAIADQFTTIGLPPTVVPFTISDIETPAASLNLRGTSSNPTLLPDGNIAFGGSGSNRTVTLTALPAQTGAAVITVFVDDGANTNSRSFNLTVGNSLLLCERFDYADGSVITNSGFFWNAHSGGTGQTAVASGKLYLTDAQSEDISATLTNAPFAPAGGRVLYAGFTVNFSARPGSQYFAHLKDTGSQNFRCRVFATTNNAAPDRFRLGLANNTGTLGATNPPLAQDLSLNLSYRVVVRYNVATGVSTLWVNPAVEADPSLTATDTPGTLSISTLAFRQSAGIGALSVDDVKVSTLFSEVVVPVLVITPSGSDVIISWTGGGTLQYTTDLTAPPASIVWQNLTGQTSPYIVSTGGPQRYYRVTVP